MPVVQPGSFDDQAILFFAHFPPALVGVADEELANVLMAP